jgi:hypothetical protein
LGVSILEKKAVAEEKIKIVKEKAAEAHEKIK